MAKLQCRLCLILFATIGCFLSRLQVRAMTHIVGGSYGWRFPSANISFYQDWARPRNFTAGDKLVFLYTTGMHSVVEVKKEDYDDCTQKNVIKTYTNGPTIFELTKPGDHFFICGLSNQFCNGGQKLSIRVMNGDTSSDGTGGLFGIITKSSSADSIRIRFGMLSGLLLPLIIIIIMLLI
ncbi:mavicyanin-like [Juglans microcarpa x Juglans regia]|uniref:mavicyanin-like n=1 Tax=Juglans microcarpa x Juglans regia TaxID=2249226 RepID=UPI001B7DF54A|nr:mavicyanin-like [Juglans microcarpa x Juglans regia]